MKVVTITTEQQTTVYDAEDVDIIFELEELGRPAIVEVEEWTEEEFEALEEKEG